MNGNLDLKHKILDNVHGFIYYSEAEKGIMDELLFKRLQSIKQLSLANWIFPGSEHTRFIHSIGVMHIADRIATQIGLSDNERKIVRMAGLLHDIGHYPLSHVCEVPYKDDLELLDESTFCLNENIRVKRKVDDYNIKIATEFMKKSNKGNHEHVAVQIIRENHNIRQIITEECGESAIEVICDMIVGNVERQGTDALLVQILHSELDADGIDYMLRDAAFAGTSFGALEIDMLIRSMGIGTYNGQRILTISDKGIAAADQYLINKHFTFSQVIYNKHIVILEWMAKKVVSWLKNIDALFPTSERLYNDWLNSENGYRDFLTFTDNFFWQSIKETHNSSFKGVLPDFVRSICEKLLNHQELDYVEGSEFKMISNDANAIKREMNKFGFYNDIETFKNRIVTIDDRLITKQVPIDKFNSVIDEKLKEGAQANNITPTDLEQDKIKLQTRRLMEGICIKDTTGLRLLCDDDRSLMKHLYGTTFIVIRTYELC